MMSEPKITESGLQFSFMRSQEMYAGNNKNRVFWFHAGALVKPGEANMAIAAMFLGDTDPATGPPSSGADDGSWRTNLDLRQIALPGVQDGPGYGYIAPLLERESTINNAVLLIDQHDYDQQVVLNPAFKALVSIAVSAYVPSLGGFLGLEGAAAAAATAFGNSMTVGMIEGTITGNMDIGAMLETAAFSGLAAGLASGINLATPVDRDGVPLDGQLFDFGVTFGDGAKASLFGYGNLSLANLAEGALDATLTAALRTGVYDENFAAGFKVGVGSNAAGLLMADLHNVISGQVDTLGGEGAPAHVIAHAVVGCAVAELQGADCGAGAVGGMVSALYAGGAHRAGLPDDQRAAATDNAELIGAVAGYLVSGGKAENVSQAAAISQSAFQNNYLYYAEAVEKAQLELAIANGDCEDGTTCLAENTRLLELNTRSVNRRAALRIVCNDVRSLACQTARNDLDAAVASYDFIGPVPADMSGLHAESIIWGEMFVAQNFRSEITGIYGREVGAAALASVPVDMATGLVDLGALAFLAVSGNAEAQAALADLATQMRAFAADPVTATQAAMKAELDRADRLDAEGNRFEADRIRTQLAFETGFAVTGVAGMTTAGTRFVVNRVTPGAANRIDEFVDGAGGGALNGSRTVEYRPEGQVALQGDAPVCGPASCSMVISDRSGDAVDLGRVTSQFEEIRPSGVNVNEMSRVLNQNNVANSATTRMTPSQLQNSLAKGNPAIVQVPTSNGGRHFIVVDSYEVVNGVPYYMTRDPYVGGRGVRADILDANMTGQGILLE
jgi:hypothetical protein